MRNYLLAIFLVICSASTISAQTTRLHRVRSKFFQATRSQKVLNEVSSILKEEDNSNAPVLMAYQGAIEAIGAKFVWSPYSKLQHLKRGMRLINRSLEDSPDDIEIRFLRFLVEHHIPAVAGIDTHLDQDKKFIMANLDQMATANLEQEFANNLLEFLGQTGRYSTIEIAQIRGAVNGRHELIRVARTK